MFYAYNDQGRPNNFGILDKLIKLCSFNHLLTIQ